MTVSQSCLLVSSIGMLIVAAVVWLPGTAHALSISAAALFSLLALLLLLLLQPSSRQPSTPDHSRKASD
jgi:membrane protein implicated in regulation of membrane protease activity